MHVNRAAFHNTCKLNNTKYYPINDDVFGLNDDQKEVNFVCYNTETGTKIIFFLKLRQTVFNFAQKELAPKAQEIDHTNGFKDMRVSEYIFLETILLKIIEYL